MYSYLRSTGYEIVFKPTIKNGNGEVKGNIDADLVSKAMIEFPNYDYAVIVSNDGDFYSLVRYLNKNGKLLSVISPDVRFLVSLLSKEAKTKIFPLKRIKNKIKQK